MYRKLPKAVFMRRSIRISLISFLIIFFFAIGLFYSCKGKTGGGEKIYISSGIISNHHSISPDGKWLSFIDYLKNEYSKIVLINLHDNKVISFTQEDIIYGPISWSADSSAIIFGTMMTVDHKNIEYCLKEIAIKGKKEKVVSKGYQKPLQFPVISATGKIIVREFLGEKEIVGKEEYSYSTLWYIDRNKESVKITEGLLGYNYCWVDDNNICFLMGIQKGDEIVSNLYLKNLKTEKEILLAEKIVPWVYLVNGEQMFYLNELNKKYEIKKLSLKYFKETSIGTIKNFFFPNFSPDGSKMAFIRKKQIWVLDLSSLKETKLTNTSFFKRFPIWTKDGKNIIYSTDKDLFMIKASE